MLKKLISRWLDKSPAPVPTKPKEFVFEVYEDAHIGDMYRYTIKADNKTEAMEKLVKFFWGTNKDYVGRDEVKQDHQEYSYPNNGRLYGNLPMWLMKRMKGHIHENGVNYQHILEEYATEHNIELKLRT